MMWIRFFIREINACLHLAMQNHARSIKGCSIEYNEIRNINNELQHARPTKDIPGPKALPLFGNWFRFMPYGEYYNVNVLTLMRMLRDKYGKIVKLDGIINKPPHIFLLCPDLCKDMYKLQGKWPTRISLEPMHYYRMNREHIYNGQYGLFYFVLTHYNNNIYLIQGELWYNLRSKVNPYMMRANFINMHVTQIHDVVDEFIEKIRGLKDPKTLELPSDFMNEIYKFSLESMCLIALDCRMGCLGSNLSMNSESQIMINCVQESFELMYRLENQPSLWKVYNTKDLKKLFHIFDTINDISTKHIEYAKMKLSKTTDITNLEKRSVLEKLLCIDKQIAHTIALDLIASTDTTSNAAGALLYHIANNMEKQEKLRKEVMSVLPDKTTPVTVDILGRIPYVKACIKESMRLFPIASGVLRTMQKDVCIGGYIIPKGTNVTACHSVLSMNPIYFPRPQEFIPERWLRDTPEYSLYKKTHPFVYMPFGYGVRMCIGQKFAEMELQTLLLKMIRNFRIEWHHGPLKYKSQIVNTVSSPLLFKLIDL
ncbi:hypothetical protein P5V15_006519 [Pogonomyrmex californicus]